MTPWFHVGCVIKTDVNHTLSKPAIADGHRRFGQNVQVIELTRVGVLVLESRYRSRSLSQNQHYIYVYINCSWRADKV